MKNSLIYCFIFLFLIALQCNSQKELRYTDYLKEINSELTKQWPHNRTVNIVFHGHSVPSGYFRGGKVRKLDSYPHLFLTYLTEKYPTAVINCITTSIGGEQAEQGAIRFEEEVLTMRPDVIFIDYALNDRSIGLERTEAAWRSMIEEALDGGYKLVLLTPTPDTRENLLETDTPLAQHSAQIRNLGREYKIPVVDAYSRFVELVRVGEDIDNYMSQGNHPNERGHQIVVDEIIKVLYDE